ncbi:MAG: alpha/beta hydrolase [Bacteroidales bacterium]
MTLFIGLLILLLYLLGPRLRTKQIKHIIPKLDINIDTVEAYINSIERAKDTKDDNQARVLWTGVAKQKTEWALLYLHGFAASWYDGFPINVNFVRGACNAYFARLPGHGLKDPDAMLEMTPQNTYEVAKEALAIASMLGNKVLIMGCSMGATLSLQLAADFPSMVHGLILYSPNIKINNPAMSLLTKPWGLSVLRRIDAGNYHSWRSVPRGDYRKYCDKTFRNEAIVYLQKLIEETMTTTTFNKVVCPVFMGYYYKDKQHQDTTVKVSAMLDMFDKLSSPLDKKVKVAFANANTHIICNSMRSGAIEDVYEASADFAVKVLGMDLNMSSMSKWVLD